MPTEPGSKLHLLENMIQHDPGYLAKRIQWIIHDGQAAEDLSQDTLLRAVRGLPNFRGDAEQTQLCPWLDQIARNLAYDYVRDRGRRPGEDSFDHFQHEGASLAEQLPATKADPALLSTFAETHASILASIQALPPEIRAVFLMRAVEERSTALTAATLGIGEALVKWRLRRARALLRQHLQHLDEISPSSQREI